MYVIIGLKWLHKKLGEITFAHPACGDNLVCTVTEMPQKFTIFFIPTITVDRRYLFEWKGCDQAFAIVDKEQVLEYQKQISAGGGAPTTPEIETLIPHEIYKPVPANFKNCLFVALAGLAMFVVGAIAVGALITFLM